MALLHTPCFPLYMTPFLTLSQKANLKTVKCFIIQPYSPILKSWIEDLHRVQVSLGLRSFDVVISANESILLRLVRKNFHATPGKIVFNFSTDISDLSEHAKGSNWLWGFSIIEIAWGFLTDPSSFRGMRFFSSPNCNFILLKRNWIEVFRHLFNFTASCNNHLSW